MLHARYGDPLSGVLYDFRSILSLRLRAAAPDVQAVHPLNPELNCWQRGGVTTEYFMAHQRCVRRLRRILARKREMEKWCEKWDAMHDRFVKEVDALQAIKPKGVQ